MYIDFERYVAERIRSYSPRPWIFDRIGGWLRAPGASRYFLLTGEPGSGKTAIAGQVRAMARGAVAGGGALPVPIGAITAHHFCFSQDVHWLEPVAFAESVSAQIAAAHPRFDEIRLARERPATGNVISSVSVGGDVTGQAIGVAFSIDQASPETAFSRLVRAPLEELYREGFEQDIFILVDALDEARLFSGGVGIFDLVTRSSELPRRVRFLLTSRPDQSLADRLALQDPHFDALDLGHPSSRAAARGDVERYFAGELEGDAGLRSRLDPTLSTAALAPMMAEKADGNFLWARFALTMLRNDPRPITPGVLDSLPRGLDAIYIDFLDRVVQGDMSRWQRELSVLLGTLAVAQREMTDSELARYTGMAPPRVALALAQLRQLLDASGEGDARSWTVYHRSFVDFLLRADRAGRYACESRAQHRRIVDTWLGQVGGEGTPDLPGSDDYGLRHVAAHLYALEDEKDCAAILQRLVSVEWRDLKRERLGSLESFVGDLELAIQAAIRAHGRVAQIRGTAVLATLRSAGSGVPPEALRLLVKFGHVESAIGYAAVGAGAARGLTAIAEELLEVDAVRAEEIARRAVKLAQPGDSREARKALARALTRLGRLAEAFDAALGLEASWRADAVAGVIAASIRAGQLAQALEWSAELDPGWGSGERILQAAVEHWPPGRASEALALVRTIWREPREASRSHALASLVSDFVPERSLELARFLLEQQAEEARPAIEQGAIQLANRGERDRATALATILGDDSSRRSVESATLRWLLAHRGVKEALGFVVAAAPAEQRGLAWAVGEELAETEDLDAALELVRGVDSEEIRGAFLSAILRAAVKRGQPDLRPILDSGTVSVWERISLMERATLDQAFQLASGIADPGERRRAGAELVDKALEEGNSGEALRAWQLLATPADEPPAALLVALAESGGIDDALRLLLESPLSSSSVEAAARVASELARAGRLADAAALAAHSKWRSSDIVAAILAAVAQSAPASLGEAAAALKVTPYDSSIKEAVCVLVTSGDLEAAVRITALAPRYSREDLKIEAAVRLFERGQKNGALALLERTELTARWVSSSPILQLVEAEARSGEVAGALAVARQAEEKVRAEALAVVAEVLADRQETAAAKEIVEEAAAIDGGADGPQSALARLAYLLACVGSSAEARGIAGRLAKPEADPRQPLVARALAAGGRADEALAVAEEVETLCAITQGLLAAGDRARVGEVLDRLSPKLATTWVPLELKNRMSQTLAAAFGPQEAVRWLGSAAGLDKWPDKQLILRLVREGARELALTLAAASLGPEHVWQRSELRKAVEELSATGRWDEAAAIAAAIGDEAPGLTQSSGPAVAAEKGSQRNAPSTRERLNAALETAEEYERKYQAAGILVAIAGEEGAGAAIQAVNGLADRELAEAALARAARELAGTMGDAAMEIAESLRGSRRHWEVAEVAGALAGSGNLEGALRLADGLRGWERDHALSTVVEKAGELAAERRVALLEQIEDKATRSQAEAGLAVSYLQGGEPGIGLRLAEAARSRPADPASLARIAEALASSGHPGAAGRFVEKILELADTVQDDWGRNHVMLQLCRHQLDRGEAVAARATAGTISPRTSAHAAALCDLARAHAGRAEKDTARELLREAFESVAAMVASERFYEEVDIAATWIALGRPAGEMAEDLCARHASAVDRVRVLAELGDRWLAGEVRYFPYFDGAEAFGKPGWWERALSRRRAASLRRRAEREAAAIPDAGARAAALSWIARGAALQGKKRRARRAAEEALSLAGREQRAQILTNAGLALGWSGQSEDARRVAGELVDSFQGLANDEELWESVRAAAPLLDALGDGELVERLARMVRAHPVAHARGLAFLELAQAQSQPSVSARLGRFYLDLVRSAAEIDGSELVGLVTCTVPPRDGDLLDEVERLAERMDVRERAQACIEAARVLGRARATKRTERWAAMADDALRNSSTGRGRVAAGRSTLAAALHGAGCHDRARAMMWEALDDGAHLDRHQFFVVLADSLPVLHGLDNGQTLAEIGQALVEVEGWWSHRHQE